MKQDNPAETALRELVEHMTLTVDDQDGRLNGVLVDGVHVASKRFRKAVHRAMIYLDKIDGND